MRTMHALILGLAVAIVGFQPAAVHADYSFDIIGNTALSTEDLGDFSGSISLFDAGTITVVLTNTSPVANGGLITGFAMENPLGLVSDMAVSPPSFTDTDFTAIGLGGISVSPFADLDIGAALGGSWTGGGNPNPGIAVGSGATFTFYTDADFSGIVANPFESATDFLVRFRGFEDGGSDKVPYGDPPDNSPPITPGGEVPEPASLITMAMLLSGSGLAMRRKKKAAA